MYGEIKPSAPHDPPRPKAFPKNCGIVRDASALSLKKIGTPYAWAYGLILVHLDIMKRKLIHRTPGANVVLPFPAFSPSPMREMGSKRAPLKKVGTLVHLTLICVGLSSKTNAVYQFSTCLRGPS